jgi:hypothetical protein
MVLTNPPRVEKDHFSTFHASSGTAGDSMSPVISSFSGKTAKYLPGWLLHRNKFRDRASPFRDDYGLTV